MIQQTECLFADDSYLAETDAVVVGIDDGGRIRLDRTIFYATSGGQPGDVGVMTMAGGTAIPISATVAGETKADILHLPAAGAAVPEIGAKVRLAIDWPRRHALMKMHTACHLLSVICPWPITGAAVSETDSRVDFDMTGVVPATKEEVSARLAALIAADHPVFTRWITEAELDANPGIVRSKNVRPPRGLGRIRLVCIGEDASIDSQPCGGTHVRSTGELGAMLISKIENKGKENRRFRIRFAEGGQPID